MGLARVDHRQVPHQVLPLHIVRRVLEAERYRVALDQDRLQVYVERVPEGGRETTEPDVELNVVACELLAVAPLDARPNHDDVRLRSGPLSALGKPVDVLVRERVIAQQRLVDEADHACCIVTDVRVGTRDVAPLRAARNERLVARVADLTLGASPASCQQRDRSDCHDSEANGHFCTTYHSCHLHRASRPGSVFTSEEKQRIEIRCCFSRMHPPSGSDISTRPKTGFSRTPDTSACGNLAAAEPSRRPEEREASDAGWTAKVVSGAAVPVVGAHPPRGLAGVWVGAMLVDWVIAAVLVLDDPCSRVLEGTQKPPDHQLRRLDTSWQGACQETSWGSIRFGERKTEDPSQMTLGLRSS